jgi:hypothetical protein
MRLHCSGGSILQDITNRPAQANPLARKRKYSGILSKNLGENSLEDSENILNSIESPLQPHSLPKETAAFSAELHLISQNYSRAVRKAQLSLRELPPCVALLKLPAEALDVPKVDRLRAVTAVSEAYRKFDFLSEHPRFAAHFALGMEHEFRSQEQLLRVDNSYLSLSAAFTEQDRHQMVSAMVSHLLACLRTIVTVVFGMEMSLLS